MQFVLYYIVSQIFLSGLNLWIVNLLYKVTCSYRTSLSLPHSRWRYFQDIKWAIQNKGCLTNSVLLAWHPWITAVPAGMLVSQPWGWDLKTLGKQPVPCHTSGWRCAIPPCSGGDKHPLWPFFHPTNSRETISIHIYSDYCVYPPSISQTKHAWSIAASFFPCLTDVVATALQRSYRWALHSHCVPL